MILKKSGRIKFCRIFFKAAACVGKIDKAVYY